MGVLAMATGSRSAVRVDASALDPSVERWWIAGDESALPAVGTLLDSLPASASAEVHLEVQDADDEIPLASAAAVTAVWHHRRGADAFGAELSDAAGAAAIAEGTQVWVACEASTVRSIRRLMLDDKRVPNTRLVTRGYWRIGHRRPSRPRLRRRLST